jgi:integrase
MPRVRETEYIDVIRLEQDDGSVHEVVIFLRHPVWYARITYDSGKTYHRISTKKRDSEGACKVAVAQFYEGRGRARLGLKITKATIASLAEDMLKEKERRVAATDRGIYVLRTYRAKVPRLNEFFGKLQPQQVTSKMWDEYVLHRLTTGKPKLANVTKNGQQRRIGRGTLEQERDTLRATLRLAVERKLISALPPMELPRLGTRKKMVSRASFSDSEIEVLIDRINRQIDGARNAEIKWNNQMLRCYLMFLLTSGLRTNDIKLLRWRDVSELARTDGGIVLQLACRGKGMEREAVSQPEATAWVRELRRIARAVGPDDLLFTGPSGKAYNFTVAFRKLLIATKLRTDANGRARSAYSLRHSFAMARIMEPGLNLTHLAENMGTSIEMMATHYLSHINVVGMVDTLTRDTRVSTHTYLMTPEGQKTAQEAARNAIAAAGLPASRKP